MVIVTLLLIAIMLSAASVLMNADALDNIQISETGPGSSTANVVFEIVSPPEEATGGDNG